MASRSIDEIYNSLVERIASQSGSSWSALKDSLVGKELLYAGANIISATEFVSESVNGVLDVSRYGMDQLIAYSRTQDVSLDMSRPSSIKLRFTGSFARSQEVCAPFSIKVQVGNLSFYNIDYCSSGGDVTLYCGSIHRMLSSTALSLPFVVGNDRSLPWRLYLELKRGTYQSSYVKLGSDVISDSVWVFAQDKLSLESPVFPYTTFNSAITDPEAKLYKVRALWDYTTCVLFGDGNWAQPVLPAQFNYDIVWLKADYSRFTITQGIKVVYTDLSGTVRTLPMVSEGSSTDGFYVTFTQDGEAQSLSYARNYVVSQVFREQGLVTETQLRNFILSFPSVQSVYLDTSLGSVDIYVKPMRESDTAFGFLEDYLYQYGVSGIHYDSHVATPIRFVVRLQATGSAGQQSLLRAVSVVRDLYSYDSVTMDTRVSSALVQQELTLQGVSGVVATLYGVHELSGSHGSVLELQSTPAVGSILQYASDGLLVGFDSEGRYKTFTPMSTMQSVSQSLLGARVSAVGDYYWLSSLQDGVSVSYLASLLDGVRLVFTDCSTSIGVPASGAEFAPYGEGLLCMSYDSVYPTGLRWQTKAIRLYRDSAVFRDGSYSLFMHPTYVSPLTRLDGNGQLVSEFYLQPYQESLSSGSDATNSIGRASVEVLRVLGVTGVGDTADTIMCAVRYYYTEDSYVSGLAQYRLGSDGTYTFDLMLMYGSTTDAMASISAYYNGRWFMPLYSTVSEENADVKKFRGVGVLDGQGSYGDLAFLGASVTSSSSWTKVYSLDAADAVSMELLNSELIDWRITGSSTVWFLYKLMDGTPILAEASYMFITDDTGSSKFRFVFTHRYTFPVDGLSRIVPEHIGPARGTSVSVYGRVADSQEGDSLVFLLTPEGESSTELRLFKVSDSSVLLSSGSVDYPNGVIYGVALDSGYLEYEVSSTLGGGSSYPLLSGVEIKQ